MEKVSSPEVKKYACVRCGEPFVPGKWFCEDGQRHEVETKTYYIKSEGLTVHYGPVRGDSVMNHARGVITFARGTYTTSDPEKKEFLDAYPACVSYDVWVEAHLSEKERDEQSKREKERLEKTNNELLAQVQALKEQLATKGDGGGAEKKGGK